MAGTEILYKTHFYDYSGNYCTVNIKKDGYTGSEIEVDSGTEPCVIRMLTDGDDKFVHIKATEATLQLASSTSMQYLPLFLDPVKTYKVEVYRGIDPIWEGWVNPEFFSEPFSSGKYITSIHCTDGLAELKNIKFPIPGVTTSDFKQPAIYYIATCLHQVNDSALTIKTAVNIGATTSDGMKTERILEELYFDYRSFQDDSGVFRSCYDVLSEILSTFNARVFQYAGAWHIERLDQKHDDYRVEIYSLDGVYGSTITYDAVTSLTAHVGAGTDIRFQNGANLEIQPAYKEFELTQEFGNRLNLLNSTSSKLFSDGDWITTDALRFWTVNGTLDYTREYNYNALRIKGIYLSGANSLQSDTISIENEGVDTLDNLMQAWINGDISMFLNFDVVKRFYARRGLNNFACNVRLWANFSGTYYYGHETATGSGIGEWSPVADLDIISVDLKDTNDWTNRKIEFNAPPEAELSNSQSTIQFYIVLYPCATNLTVGDVIDSDGILFRDLSLNFQYTTKSGFEANNKDYNRSITTTIDTSNILKPETYEIKFADTPAPWGAVGTGVADGWGLVNKYVIFDSNGKAVNKFGIVSTPPYPTPSYSLVNAIIINTDLQITYRRPLAKLKGTIIDTTLQSGVATGLDFRTCLKDYDNRYYIATGLEYDLKASTFTGEWLEIWNEGTTGEFNDDFSDDFFT